MALGHGPTVVTNGLVLALDAADINSFDKYENLLTYTSNIGGPNGYLSTASATPNTSETLDPNGTSTATKLDNAGNVNTYTYSQSTTLSTNTTYTYSIHIKQGTKPDFSVTIDENSFGGKRYQTTFTYSTETITTSVGGGANDGVLVGSSVTKLTNGWYRLSITFTTSTTSVSTFVDMMNRFGNTPGTNYVWGRQLEIGTSTNTYYATTGTAKTRGTTWTDLSGIGNNGTLTAGQTYNSGNSGSINFNGANNQIVSVGTANQYFYGGNLNITFEAWVKSAGLAAGKTVNGIFSFSYGNLLYMNSDGSISFGIWNQAANNWGYLATTSGLNLLDNKWHQVVGTMSATTGAIYTDGVLRTSGSGTHTGTNVWIGMGAQIGNNQNDAYYHFNGSIAIAKFYRSALTAAEVSQNFNALRGRFGV